MNLSVNPKYKKSLITYTYIALSCILLTGLLVSLFYMGKTRIGSDLYQEIMLSDNLTADILSPPENIIESYTVALEYLNESDKEIRADLLSQIQTLEGKYLKQHDFWKTHLPDYKNLREVFLVQSYNSAQEFYDIFFNQIVPAVAANNKSVISSATAMLKNAYVEHRKAIDSSVKLAEQWRVEIFNKSKKLSDLNKIIMVMLIITLLGLSTLFGLFIRRSEKALISMAYYDGLTGLPSRKLFSERLDEFVSNPEVTRFAVVFFDLDGFKNVNDTLGHAAGDTLLCEVTNILLVKKHPADMLSRFSGDEFAILINRRISNEETLEYVGELQEAIRKTIVIDNKTLLISASFGIAFYPDNGNNSKGLLMRADIAMYSVKNNGGDGVKLSEES